MDLLYPTFLSQPSRQKKLWITLELLMVTIVDFLHLLTWIERWNTSNIQPPNKRKLGYHWRDYYWWLFQNLCPLKTLFCKGEIPTKDLPTVEILEQPCQSYRFRYSSEQGVVACLHGTNSTQNRKTFPKIKISNFDNSIWTEADVYVSCVTHDEDPKPYNHPNMVMNNKRVT